LSLLGNYVKLEPDKPKTLRLSNPRIVEKVIRDPKTGRLKTVKALEFDVTEEDGIPVSKVFSTLSEKLATQLWTLWESSILSEHKVQIIWHPRDYATEYEVRVI